MPLRAELEQAAALRRSQADEADPFTILVMGGSGGARRLNEVIPDALAAVIRGGARIEIVHVTGKAGESSVREAYLRLGVPADVRGFTHDMAALYTRASLAICRSGAATCAELAAFGVPALLVPYPFAVRNHQMANARAFEKTEAADVVADADLTAIWLASYLRERMAHPERLRAMRAALRARGRANGTAGLADLVEASGRSHGTRGSTSG
jgi:UDP-N-acetylglucosamine--N-acetylmuramyl-(pentapeptide) pyrophosphoryl-undecaprenol N-acetylglucosamine transferase